MKIKTIELTNPNVTLTCYLGETSKEMPNLDTRKAILIFPGGGYQFCSDREAEPVALGYLQKGYNAFVLRYSVMAEGDLSTLWPKPLEEAEIALRYLRDNSDKLGIYKDKIACIGFSAGGHLSAALATMGKVRPNAAILIYPAIIAEPRYGWPFPTIECDKDTPESFVATTHQDEVVPWQHSLHYVSECSKHGIPVEFHLFRDGRHGLSLGNEVTANNHNHLLEPDFSKWLELSASWLNKVL